MVLERRSLARLKKDYSALEKKYTLPSFEEMNAEFGIEELFDAETDFLARVIRKSISEKLSFFYRFIEVILNPSEGNSLFVFSLIKNLKQEDRKFLAGIYEKLSKIHLQSIKRDIIYSEEEEAKFIKEVYSFWKASKTNLFEIVDRIESSWGVKPLRNEKSYFR